MRNFRKIEQIKYLLDNPIAKPIDIKIHPDKGVFHRSTGTLIVLSKYSDDYKDITRKIVCPELKTVQEVIKLINHLNH